MKTNLKHIEQFKIEPPAYWNAVGPDDVAGRYLIPGPGHHKLIIVFTSAHDDPWEHASISVHRKKRAPTWDEMCFVKDLFWKDEEMCWQYHPSKEDYVNCHPYCLHIWRHKEAEIPKPPPLMVGPKGFKIKYR